MRSGSGSAFASARNPARCGKLLAFLRSLQSPPTPGRSCRSINKPAPAPWRTRCRHLVEEEKDSDGSCDEPEGPMPCVVCLLLVTFHLHDFVFKAVDDARQLENSGKLLFDSGDMSGQFNRALHEFDQNLLRGDELSLIF